MQVLSKLKETVKRTKDVADEKKSNSTTQREHVEWNILQFSGENIFNPLPKL